jgi:hypothetical protein
VEGAIGDGIVAVVVGSFLEEAVALVIVLVTAFVLAPCEGVGCRLWDFSLSCCLYVILLVVSTPFVDLVCPKNPCVRGDLRFLL